VLQRSFDSNHDLLPNVLFIFSASYDKTHKKSRRSVENVDSIAPPLDRLSTPDPRDQSGPDRRLRHRCGTSLLRDITEAGEPRT
jgi:hypothetical protein